MKKIILTLFLASFFLCTSAYSFSIKREIQKTWTTSYCKIAAVDDWDTFDLDCISWYYPNVRLLWANAPDKEQVTWYEHCFYKEAKKIIEWTKNRRYNVVFYWSDLCKDESKWCRNLVRLTDDATKIDLAEIMISKWFIFSWTQFSIVSKDIKENYIKAESQARSASVWLWSNCKIVYNEYTHTDSWIANKMTD